MTAAAVSACGMTTAIGLTAPASCAAFRARLDNFQETRFISHTGDWVLGAEVPLAEGWRGAARLANLVAGPLRECFEAAAPSSREIPVLLCLAERDRPGRGADLEDLLVAAIEDEFGHPLAPSSRVYAFGQVGGAVALRDARNMVASGAPAVIVAGVDSYLSAETLRVFGDADRLLTEANSNGFIAGEAGAAVLIEGAGGADSLQILGVGFGAERSHINSGEPMRAEGLVTAMRQAFEEAGIGYDGIDYRVADLDGEQFYFREAALAQARLWRGKRDPEDIWQPCDGMGQTGAAVIPICLGIGLVAHRKAYAPGPVALVHAAHDDGRRAAIVTRGGG